jgi:regulator of protease activity HflC (stomatin/prohibitin superfamily)
MIRSTVPRLYLDDIFSARDSIASEFRRSLNDDMNRYGLLVHHALITGLRPNESVKRSMNEVQASKRTKEAMPHIAEAARILTVKDAEARAERAHLIGVGMARERREIARGMRDVMDGVDDGGRGAKGAMDLLLLIQYYELLTKLNGARLACGEDAVDDECREGHGGYATSLFLMHMPDAVSRLTETARECFTRDAVRVENLLDLK